MCVLCMYACVIDSDEYMCVLMGIVYAYICAIQ